jgi:anoctamin-10/anoctamin-7
LEFWKREQSALAVKWGMTHFSLKEQPRPEFEGSWIRSPINGKLEEYFPFWAQVFRVFFSQGVVWMLIIAVIAAVIGVFFLRSLLARTDTNLALIVAAVVNAVVIQIFNYVRFSSAAN